MTRNDGHLLVIACGVTTKFQYFRYKIFLLEKEIKNGHFVIVRSSPYQNSGEVNRSTLSDMELGLIFQEVANLPPQ